MFNVVIADDHSITRSGIKYILKDCFPHSGIYEAENGDEVLNLFKTRKIDILLMDLNMPNTDPQRLVQTLLVMEPDLKILVISMNKEEIFGPLYLRLGVKGFIPKELGEQELLKAIQAVRDGNLYIRKEMRDFYEGNIKLANPYELLTKKEMEILRHFIKGDSAITISRTMNIGISTVSTHKANIFEKLNISNLLELKSLSDLYPL